MGGKWRFNGLNGGLMRYEWNDFAILYFPVLKDDLLANP